jgi:D-sedoheptulose 7-phosphate isomerase
MTFTEYNQELIASLEKLQEQQALLRMIVAQWQQTLYQGKRIFFCGNGGSAADAQHLAAELVGRYKNERQPLPGISLTVDTSALTAIGNDYGFEEIFSRQLQALGQRYDLLMAISTSGNSANVCKAVTTAHKLGMTTIGLTGQDGGNLKSLCNHCVCVPSQQTNHIQEMHIAIGHYLCQNVESIQPRSKHQQTTTQTISETLPV